LTEIAVFLCDLTGIAARPWAEAGVTCYCVDIQHSIRRDRVEGNIHFVWGDVRTWRPPTGSKVIFGAAFTPCTHVTVADARDFVKKGGYMLRDGLEMFEAGRQALSWSGAPNYSENPVGVLSSIPHIGKPDFYFDPSDYAGWCEDDNYTKKTCLWTGNGFVMPPKRPAPWLGEPDKRIWNAAPSDDRANIRSATPLGFSKAVFAANAPLKYRQASLEEMLQ
jgi:hypothetical protein